MEVRVYATPALLPEISTLSGWTAVVIDALRMTSAAATALSNGCAGLMAVGEVDQARTVAKAHGALLGGERSALPIEGFDFSNSPLAYQPARIAGRRLVMTTSNGTRAILAAEGADTVLLGAFINATAVARRLRGASRVAMICAGTLGAFTLEDALAAGAILQRIRDAGTDIQPDDMAVAAGMLYAAAKDDLAGALAHTAHYNRLKSLGLLEDLSFCLTEDIIPAVPERRTDGWFA